MLYALVAAFLGGLILNIMPCVFPIISLKALGLVRHGGNPAQMRVEGLAFALGALVTMLALAGALIAARAAGTAVGWGYQLQSPLVIAVLGLVMLGAALNLAGLFEVGLMAQRLGGGHPPREGALGAALTGVLAIVVATPCTAPFMAGALGYALVQPPLVALLVFAMLALGFAAPFVLVALVPSLARRIPRPGAWMGVAKRLFAFPMFGAAAWLAWVLDHQAGAEALGALLACAVAVAFAAWIYGMAQQRHMAGQRAGGLYALSGVVMALVAGGLVASIQPVAQAAPQIAANAPAAPGARLAWSPEQLAALRGKGRPIFVNFTAAWCITCQVNDKAALSTPQVKAALARTGTTYMIADATRYDPQIDEALAGFGRAGLPLYVVYPANGGAPVILPQVLSAGMVASALARAAASGPVA